MNKQDLMKLKLKIYELSESEKRYRDLYLRDLASGKIQGPLTGYSSIDKTWLSKYPEELFSFLLRKPKYNKIYDKMKATWKNPEEEMIIYNDNGIKVKEFNEEVNKIAKAFIQYGIKEGDSVVMSLESVPEFLEILMAAELIGCSIKNYIGNIDNIVDLINNDEHVKCYIAPTYLSSKDARKLYEKTNVKNIIMIDPLFSVKDKSKVRDNIVHEINSRFFENPTKDERNINWEEFLKNGNKIKTIYQTSKSNLHLFSAFTSGTTGEPKEVMHSSESMLGIIEQMALFPSHDKERDTWLLTILPPTLVAIVVAMMCYPLLDGKKLIMDPYCKMEDIDIEMMNYRPTCWGLIPIFFSSLIESKRIPDDYDMSYFKLFGFGAEPMTKKFMMAVEEFKEKHNCHAPFSSGYGQSEGGSDFTVAMGKEMLLSGSSGIPLINTTIAIFEPNTFNELQYNKVGEICKSGPGIMIGYSDEEMTSHVLKKHPDGQLWLHTGDYGFMTEDGLLFVLGRQGIKVSSTKTIFPLQIENKISMVEGVKESIIVSGKNKKDDKYEAPYLFIIPESHISLEDVLTNVNHVIKEEFSREEVPQEIHFIDKKPIHKFKTDRKTLQKSLK